MSDKTKQPELYPRKTFHDALKSTGADPQLPPLEDRYRACGHSCGHDDCRNCDLGCLSPPTPQDDELEQRNKCARKHCNNLAGDSLVSGLGFICDDHRREWEQAELVVKGGNAPQSEHLCISTTGGTRCLKCGRHTPPTPAKAAEVKPMDIASNIVYQLGDLYELPVELRQRTNDQAIEFVANLLEEHRETSDELTSPEQQEITKILEGYRSNPSNSNKFRYELFDTINQFLAARQPQGAVGEVKLDYNKLWKLLNEYVEACKAREAGKPSTDARISRTQHLLTEFIEQSIAARQPQGAVGEERINMAAIRYQGVVYTGLRHNLIFRDLGEMKLGHIGAEQGFATNTGRYVDRKEAMVIAEAAGQIIKKTGPSDSLFSEDIYDGSEYAHQTTAEAEARARVEFAEDIKSRINRSALLTSMEPLAGEECSDIVDEALAALTPDQREPKPEEKS